MASAESSSNIDTPIRRDRAAIAAQACQTCRSRKSKCDEKRPKCSLCNRLGLDCEYREPLPTKKDKTMVQILDAINRLEVKFDNIHPAPITAADNESRTSSTTSVRTLAAVSSSRRLEHLSVPHKVAVWPSIYVHLSNIAHPSVDDLQFLVQDGTAWLVRNRLSGYGPQLDNAARLRSEPFLLVSRGSGPSPNVHFPALSMQQLQAFAEAYFETFNILFPIIDQNVFANDIFPHVVTNGYTYGDSDSVLALLIFALGKVALEGALGQPLDNDTDDRRRSGIRGGSLAAPPGLEIFNEARTRIPFLTDNCSVELVQCLLLQATYYGANSMSLDFWRSSTAASSVCQLLVRNASFDQATAKTELLRRVYWTCHLSESICRFNLCLSGTGIQALQSSVPMPSVNDLYQNLVSGLSGDHAIPRSEHYFHALLSIEKLIYDINLTILEPAAEQSQTASSFHGPPMPLVREMARQLDSWRSLLPRHLKWLDNERFEFPSSDYDHRRPSEQLFAPDQGPIPIRHGSNLDVTTACLRSRFYFAKHMLYQPFIYKVLHFPELMTKDDADCVAMAIRSACMWPVLMAPVKDKKRLIPFVFSWTQTFSSMLLIFEMTRLNDALRNICEDQVDPAQVKQTVALMLEWLRDAQHWDGLAAWGYPMLELLLRR